MAQNSHRVSSGRNCGEPFARLRNSGASGHDVAHFLCGFRDWLCWAYYALARVSSKCRCAKRECEDDAYVSDRPAAQATWSAYCFHALIVMRLRNSRKLIRHLRAQCFACDSLKFEKRSQFFVGGDDESLCVGESALGDGLDTSHGLPDGSHGRRHPRAVEDRWSLLVGPVESQHKPKVALGDGSQLASLSLPGEFFWM